MEGAPTAKTRLTLKFFCVVIFFALAFFAFYSGARPAHAAELSISPSSGTFHSGDIITVAVYASSIDQAMNAVSGALAFPNNILGVVSLSKAGSQVALWVEDPSFSDFDGIVNFQGVIPNPGYTGSHAKIISITFRVKSVDTAKNAGISFSAASVLANDGAGSNILTGTGKASYVILPSLQVPEASVTTSGNSIPTPNVSSPTHPDENKWYSTKTSELTWGLPAGVDGVSYSLDTNSSATPDPQQSKGLVASVSYDLTKYTEGVWYFHARFHTKDGWGKETRRKVKVDFSSPNFLYLDKKSDPDLTDPTPAFEWEAQDSVSGIAGYKVKVGDGAWFDSVGTSQGSTILPPQAPGSHVLSVQAYDQAGNLSEASTTFSVEPLPMPRITSYPKTVRSPSEALVVSGETEPGFTVNLDVRKDNSLVSFSTVADSSGHWSAVYNSRIDAGSWELKAQAEDSRGALSLETAGVSVEVSGWLAKILQFITEWGLLLAALIIIGGLLATIYYLVTHRVSRFRSRLKRELWEFKAELQKDLQKIEEDLGNVESKRKVDLSPGAARRLKENLRSNIVHLEKDVKEEIEKIDDSA